MSSPHPWARHRRRRALALLAALPGLVLVLAAGPAVAHSILVTSTPGPGDTVPALTEVRLNFAAELATEGHAVTLVTAADEVAADGYEQPEASSLVARFDAEVPEGEHEIVFDVVAGDGHHERGRIPITVGAPPPTDPATAASAADGTDGADAGSSNGETAAGGAPADGDGFPAAAVLAGVVVVAGAGAAVALRARRGTPRS